MYSTELPDVIDPNGISKDRAKYLFKTIRRHVPDSAKDILCPEIKVTDQNNNEQSASEDVSKWS